VFGYGASLFLIGFIILEIPSNLALARFGARTWLARIAVSWGLVTVLMALAEGPKSFLLLRFLVGAAEAGSFPGIMLVLSFWFPQAYRARLNAIFLLSIPISNAVSPPLAAGLMELNATAGLAGWQWLFIVEGLLSVLVGIAVWRLVPDRPAAARWLAPAEKEALQSLIDSERGAQEATRKLSVGQALRDRGIILVGIVYSGINLSLTTAAFWLPQVMRSTGLPIRQVGLLSAVPFVLGAVAMIFWGRRSDRSGERFWHAMIPALVASAGWALAAVSTTALQVTAAVSVAAIGHFCATAIIWTFPSRFVTGRAAAAGYALVSAIANGASAFGPPIIGRIKDSTGGWTYALLCVSLYILITPVGLILLRKKIARV
jgi:MFS family permease